MNKRIRKKKAKQEAEYWQRRREEMRKDSFWHRAQPMREEPARAHAAREVDFVEPTYVKIPLHVGPTRTEEEIRAFLWAFTPSMHVESRHERITQADEHSVEREVWQYTFTFDPKVRKQTE